MITLKPFTAAATVALTVTVLAFGWVGAANANEGEIAYRKAVMKSVGGHMGAMKGIIKGETANKGNLIIHAQGMAALAQAAAKAFPKGSGPEAGKTEALAKIWSDWDNFVKVANAFSAESEKLAKIAEAGDMKAVAAQFSSLGKNACKACHDDYREKKK